ncbi:hypothetical protein AB0H37_42295 [Actinomadura sp. NPDC023710]|uniref:hypothetical protein n=1 Tax=Actinomadura sp. NPDC023710 TaxID=3158219 RepID=UPI0033F3DADD
MSHDTLFLAQAARLARSLRLPGTPPGAADADLVAGELLAASSHLQGRTSSAARTAGWREAITAADPGLLQVLAYHPGDLVERLTPDLLNTSGWSTLVELYEAAFHLAAAEAAPGLAPYGRQVAITDLARIRWVLLSAPFTPPPVLDGDPPTALTIDPADRRRLEDGAGTDPRAGQRLLTLAQQARDDWAAVLDARDDHPHLAARLQNLETDLLHLASVSIRPSTAAHATGAPAAPHRERDARAVDRAVTGHLVRRHLLPRFAWGPSARTTWRLLGTPARAATLTAAAAMAASAILFVLAATTRHTWGFTAAAWAATAGYALVAAATVLDRAAAWPWLLRQPAGAAIGLVSLAAFAPDWWRGGPGETGRAVTAAAVIAATGIGYLYIEAANHGITGSHLARRPLGVGLLGLAHAFWTGLIGLRFLLPVFAENPDGKPGEPAPLSIACWFAQTGCQGQALPAGALLALAAAWSFAVGVFLQIIWDDQPATAPLAHVSWRRGG